MDWIIFNNRLQCVFINYELYRNGSVYWQFNCTIKLVFVIPIFCYKFFCPVFTSIFIGTDYSDGTIRNRLIVGHTRKNIYLANFISICSVNIVITLIASAVIILLGIFMFGWYIVNPMLFTVYYLSGIMMIIAFASFFTSVSMIIHSKTISAVTCIIAFLISCIVEGIVQRLVFCHYNGEQISDVFSNLSEDMVSQPLLEFLYDFIPTGQCFQITRDIALHPLKLPIYSAVFTIITVVCGVLAFNQKDIK